MNKLLIAAVITVLAISIGFMYGVPGVVRADNNLDGCIASETAGPCLDKCPEGYSLQGFDKETGAVVCKAPPTGCPYGDSVPLGPECDGLAAPAPETMGEAMVDGSAETPAAPPFEGK